MSESTIAERLSAVNTKLNTILTNTNTQLTNKGKSTVSDINNIPSAMAELKNPTGIISIIENGNIDVSDYATANVNVQATSEYVAKMEITQSISSSDTFKETITEIGDLSSTSLTKAGSLFVSCINLKKIGNLDFPNCTYNYNMFSNCQSLESIEKIDLTNSTNLVCTFINCRALKSINRDNKIISKKATLIGSMFENCYALEKLDLTEFDTSKVTSAGSFVSYCTSLVSIDFGSQFNFASCTNMSNMFAGCTKLSNDSLNSILGVISRGTKLSTANKTLKYLGLTSTQATTCTTLSNWAAAQTAGWTTGY